jgi:Coenzyme PQQ synthesis protein D (PqqD)
MALMKPKTRAELTVVELDGEAIVYDDETRRIHHLNPTATIVFNLCDGQSTIAELSGEIADAFNLEQSEVERQVRTLLRLFRKERFLEGSPLNGEAVSSNGKRSSRPAARRNGTRTTKATPRRVKR